MESQGTSNFHIPPPLPGPATDINSFTRSFDGQVKPAVSSEEAIHALEEQEISPAPGEGPAGSPVQPLFVRPEPGPARDHEEEEEPVIIKKWKNTELTESLEMFMNFRSMLQSQLLALYAKNPDVKPYEMTEEQMQHMARVYAPLFRKHGNKIPDAIWIVLTEVMVLLPLIKQAHSDRKVIAGNAAVAGSPAVASQFAATAAPTKERTTFKVDNKGRWERDLYGAYIKEPERTEIADLKKYLQQIVNTNGREKVAKVFGVDINNIPEKEY